jgi:hypothetical protein
VWKWIVVTAVGAGGMFVSNWFRQRRIQELSLEGLATVTVPGNFSLKPGAWNYTAWATGSYFGQTPLAETHDPAKISFCLPNRLRTDIGGNTRHDGYVLLTLFRDPQEPFDPMHHNRLLLPTESYWAPGFKTLPAAGDIQLFKAEGSWPALIAYDPLKRVAAFLLAPKYTLDEACQLLSRVVDSVRIDDARLASYFEKAEAYPKTRSEKISANLSESRVNLAGDNWPMPGESTETRKVWYTDDGRLHLRERILVLAASGRSPERPLTHGSVKQSSRSTACLRARLSKCLYGNELATEPRPSGSGVVGFFRDLSLRLSLRESDSNLVCLGHHR